ncbi:MAG: T9SS type A sorting domain-containing protein [candidate division KSB1 bacterium]|nr:T9SS type A sorting domain-containing protein [candidate division KSB1 bacterium]MDZ7334366.1 T9SS type A sorting domain-containing protein [candidate division KSB1 bacterium]MDZ7356407.1 T9SS type A sorting domain-containing protein [candidate division KSB1 bacterium]MDZ7399285.1 T9SS type A sorting domain-containing protein [candidate division KSB1 bacterium]
MTIIKPIDLSSGLMDSSILVKTDPELSSNLIRKIFDGNQLTEAALFTSDSLVVTLKLINPVEISRSKVFFWHNGKWSLETAETETDLQNKTGSYRILVNNADFFSFQWDSVSFETMKPTWLRLNARNYESKMMLIGEWQLLTTHNLIGLKIMPQPLRLIPGTSLKLKVKIYDDRGVLYPYTLSDPIYWNSDNPNVAIVDDVGLITGIALGSANVIAATPKLKGTTAVTVETDFTSPKAKPLYRKVAVVIQDQIIDFTHKRRIHEVRGWNDPMRYIYQLIDTFNEVSDGVVQYQIADVRNDQVVFSRMDGEFMTIDTLAYFFGSNSRLYGRETPGTLQYIAEIENRVKFDYNAMIDYYDFANKRNMEMIHEVWVYAWPFAAMYESQLVGPNAFWYNSPPLSHPGLQKQLPVMGWNYERDLACALESYGHRSESAISHAFGGWNTRSPNPTDWDIFTRIDKDFPGMAHVGSIHFPPNGLHDYDFANPRYVVTYADNWKRYPIILNQTRVINASEWGFSHEGYMRWWFNHLPRYEGVTDSMLNNWWHYIVDYEGAVEQAKRLLTKVTNETPHGTPRHYRLEQNYPNPFNPTTKIRFELAADQQVVVKLYDLLGREVKTLLHQWYSSGRHEITLDGSELASGIYFYRIQAGSFTATKKCILLK